MTILTPEQLTGRVGTHVITVPQLSCRLHPEAAAALLALERAAAASGLALAVASSFRDFDRQLTIWNDKFHGRRPLLDATGRALDAASLDEEARVRAILQWSALPGASRHHWGSDLDVFDRAALPPGAQPRLTPEEYAGACAPLSAWLDAHGAEFGFFRPYDSARGGVQPEPWHLSYAPLAVPALAALTPQLLQAALHEAACGGAALAGAAAVQRLLPQIHERYVRRVAVPAAAALANRAATPS